jgi:hypothetical protein
MALLDDGTVRAWGGNTRGALGTGSAAYAELTPVRVIDPSDPSGCLTGVESVSAGGVHTLAIK